MDKLAYITGTSRGIGKALALLLLREGYKVIGVARHNSIDHPNYTHLELDLNDLEAMTSFEFMEEAEKVLLINNAGMLGDIDAVGKINDESIVRVMNVNTLAPQILCNKFIKRFQNHKGKFQILNISSGAGKRPIPSWASYCASKAAIDLYSETIAEELEWKQMNNWSIHSCAPGVVDTQMQSQIRSVSEDRFKLVDNFKAYKSNDELYSADYVASKLFELIENPQKFPEVVLSVRDF
ncbi:MAG: SDR family NAD(P)-dependent oxidoreductase [Crocinitomicaceae bacterium]|nr:SDR family NAD(P)-dependent oxidoreductase [Crocinitomicaceae bacterium]